MASVFDTSSRSERKQQRQDRLVTFYARAWQFFDQNSGLVYGALAALVAVVLGVAGYLYYQNQQAAAAAEALAPAQATYASGNYQAALGAGQGQAGLLEVVEDYGSTPAGNLARLMAADAYYKTDQPDKALDLLEDFEVSETLYGAGGKALEATIHENRENFEQAATLYLEAAELYPTEESAPDYLINAGRNFEAAGDYEAALDAYRRVEEEYPDADAVAEIPRYVARAEAQQQGG
jgi:tetratricopeptide (TPR) repeat protein